jgi:hypothetical protein
MLMQIKINYNDVKLLRELCNVAMKRTTKIKSITDNIVFKFTDETMTVMSSNSYVFNIIEFGQDNKPVFTVDSKKVLIEDTFVVLVQAHDLLDKCRLFLKHKKSTINDTLMLNLNGGRDNKVTDIDEYKTMDNFYFTIDGKNDNSYNLNARTQDYDIKTLTMYDKVIDDFASELAERCSMTGTDFLNTTPDIFHLDVDMFTLANKIMNMNSADLTTNMRYVKDKFYLWKTSMGLDDNTINKESIIMLRKGTIASSDETRLEKYVKPKSNVLYI